MARRNYQNNKGKDDKFNKKGNERKSDGYYPKDGKGTKVSEKLNDVSWYSKNEALLRDAASLSYFSPVGAIIDLEASTYVPVGEGASALSTIPGIMAIHVVPCCGPSNTPTSAINIAARNIYAAIRRVNSGARNYESADLMMYLLTMDSAYAWFCHLVRAYKSLNSYSMYNKYLAKALVQAMGFNYDDLMSRLPDFRYYINQLAIRLDAFAVPAIMSLNKRHMWEMLNVFADDDTIKAQLYFYKPDGFYKFSGRTSETGSELIYKSINNQRLSFDEVVAYTEDMLSPIIADEDIAIMSGDVLKAFTAGNLMKLPTIDESGTVSVGYSEEVLSQIHNAKSYGIPVTSKMNITQANGDIVFNPEFVGNAFAGGKRIIFDMYKNEPTAGDTMVASILTTVPSSQRSTLTEAGDFGNVYTNLSHFTCDICTGFEIFKFVVNEIIEGVDPDLVLDSVRFHTWNLVVNNSFWNHDEQADPLYALGSVMSPVSDFSKFNMHPEINFAATFYPTEASASQEYVFFRGFDVENYTTIGDAELKKMHDTAVLSMLDVPISFT